MDNSRDKNEEIRLNLSDDQILLYSKNDYPLVVQKAAKDGALMKSGGEIRLPQRKNFNNLITDHWKDVRMYEGKWRDLLSDKVFATLWGFSEVPWPLFESPVSLADFPNNSVKFWEFLYSSKRLFNVKAVDVAEYVNQERQRFLDLEVRARLLTCVRPCDRREVNVAMERCKQALEEQTPESAAIYQRLMDIKKDAEQQIAEGAFNNRFGIPVIIGP